MSPAWRPTCPGNAPASRLSQAAHTQHCHQAQKRCVKSQDGHYQQSKLVAPGSCRKLLPAWLHHEWLVRLAVSEGWTGHAARAGSALWASNLPPPTGRHAVSTPAAHSTCGKQNKYIHMSVYGSIDKCLYMYSFVMCSI